MFDKDNCGNLLVYIGPYTLILHWYRKCPACNGRGFGGPYEDPCFACYDECEILFWWAWVWTIRLKIHYVRGELSRWRYERTHKDDQE